MNIFDKVIERKKTNSVKWDSNNDNILPMWVADMDFLSPPKVIEAIENRAAHGVYGYTKQSDSFYNAIINWQYERHNWLIEKKWLINSSGVVPSISIALQTFAKPGDKVLLQSPVYHPFFEVIKNTGCEVVDSPLIYEGTRYSMDFHDLEHKLSAGVKIIILCSPHNPVGRVWTQEELSEFGELCTKYGVIVLSDEIWCDLVFSQNKHYPIGAFSNLAEQTITFIAPSKTFNLAGLSTSFTIIPNDQLRESFKSTIEKLDLDINNIFGDIALEAAYRHGEEWLDDLLIYLSGNLTYSMNFIGNEMPSIKVIKPEGTYLLWLDCKSLGMSGKELNELFIKEAKVRLINGSVFGPLGDGFMRMNIACPRSILKEGLTRIASVID